MIAPIAQNDTIADGAAFAGGRVDDDAFLDCRTVSYLDGPVITAQDRAVSDVTTIPYPRPL